MRTKKVSNATIFLAAQALGRVYQQPIRAKMLAAVRDASGALGPKVQQAQEVAQRIRSDHESDRTNMREQMRELDQAEKEVQVPALDMNAVRQADPALTGPQWDALELIFEKEELPQPLPHRDVLEDAGITTREDLPEDLTEVTGIGDAYAEEIRAALS